jgi:hypothetical protein
LSRSKDAANKPTALDKRASVILANSLSIF